MIEPSSYFNYTVKPINLARKVFFGFLRLVRNWSDTSRTNISKIFERGRETCKNIKSIRYTWSDLEAWPAMERVLEMKSHLEFVSRVQAFERGERKEN